MIDRYIYAVTQKLPVNQRKDISIELRGLIEDMLEERMQETDSQEKLVKEILLELGHPKKLANKYRGTKRYVIGPEIFDTYLLVLKIVLICVAGGIGISFIVQTAMEPTNILSHFIDMIVSIVTGIPMAFGWTTFSFAMVDLFGTGQPIDLGTENEWDPADLPEVPEKKRQIPRGDSIAGIVFYTIMLVFLSFSSDYFGIWTFQEGFSGVIPFLNEQTYTTYLLFIILIFGVGILKEVLKLVSGKWTYKLATYIFFINIVSIIATLILITRPDFWNPEFMDELVQRGMLIVNSEAYNVITKIWDQLTFWLLILLLVGLIIDALVGFLKARKK